MKRVLGAVLVLLPLVACASQSNDSSEASANEAAATEAAGTFSADPTGASKSCASGKKKKEQCGNGQDDDCDGLVDCQDPDCSGVGSCPVCGAVDKPNAEPLALPDGNDGDGVPYESKLRFKGFPENQRLEKVGDLIDVCVTAEHSWLRDLEIKLVSPDGKEVVLSDFRGREGGKIFLGVPNVDDDADEPIAGKGAEYCWSATAKNPAMLDSADAKKADDDDLFGLGSVTLTEGTYSPAGSFDTLLGTPLNGDWTIRVTDRWSADNGFVFGWSISFAPSLVADCSAPLAETDVK